MGRIECCASALDLRLVAASVCSQQHHASLGCCIHQPKMPRITLTLEPELLDKIQQHKPKRQALSAFCADLIEQTALGLDSASKLPAYRVGAGTSPLQGPSMQDLPTEQVKQGSPAQQVLGSLAQDAFAQSVEPEKKEIKAGKKRKSTAVTPEFEAFWQAYQSCPRKVPSQSKARAWAEWTKALKQESADRLVEAANKAVLDAITCEWDYKLPDCFRWLRDGRYSALLETHVMAKREGDWI